ncbi:MAG: family 43 glycosylhydrolase, partial [Mucilaginibacter sp.]|nr:family 43 glycosylhydrolase [Mucilaginibacter sp.]
MRNFFLKEVKIALLKTTTVLLVFVATIFSGCRSQKSIPISKSPENPFIRHMYTADPSARVFKDGRLYVYASHDVDPPRGCDLMDQYHVFSTDNMVNWKDHGEILRASQVPWGRKEGGFMWAPDCVYKNGTYYFYFPHPSGTEWNKTWKIGIATSKKPASDFVVQGYLEVGN